MCEMSGVNFQSLPLTVKLPIVTLFSFVNTSLAVCFAVHFIGQSVTTITAAGVPTTNITSKQGQV